MSTDLHVVMVEQQDRRLGRQCVQHPGSRAFPMREAVDTSTWRTKSVRLYDPRPNPNQPRGNCTGCDKAMEGNTVGNRVRRRVLTMDDADRIYSLATTLDPWEGSWPPTDTGSSGLAASKAAQQLGLGGEYRWALGGGADAVVQAIMAGRTVGVGTWWLSGMFSPKPMADLPGQYLVEPTGSRRGGHQYRVHGYHEPTDTMRARCWWGSWARSGVFHMKREHLNDLLMDDGDAHYQDMTP